MEVPLGALLVSFKVKVPFPSDSQIQPFSSPAFLVKTVTFDSPIDSYLSNLRHINGSYGESVLCRYRLFKIAGGWHNKGVRRSDDTCGRIRWRCCNDALRGYAYIDVRRTALLPHQFSFLHFGWTWSECRVSGLDGIRRQPGIWPFVGGIHGVFVWTDYEGIYGYAVCTFQFPNADGAEIFSWVFRLSC